MIRIFSNRTPGLLLLIILLNSSFGFGQDLKDLKWKNRLVVIKTTDPDSAFYLEQLNELSRDIEGLKDRKIVIFTVMDSLYRDHQKNSWKPLHESDNALFETESDFEILLIGLDGGVKLRKKSPVSRSALFALIDKMPMRRAELKVKN